MGIYDRDYYRRDRSGVFAIFEGTGQVCTTIIVVTVAVFILQVVTGVPPLALNTGPITSALEFDSKSITHEGQVWRLLTYAFLHSTKDIWHIILNMFLFWMVGREIESIYGPKEFFAFYLVAAVCGGLAQLLAGWAMPQLAGRMLGASGAVTAVLVLFAMHFPSRIFYLMFVIPVPAIALVVLFVVFDAFGLVSGNRGNIAVACHLGGAAFGFLYYKLGWRVTRWWPSMPSWKKITGRQPHLRVYRGESYDEPMPVHAGGRSAADSELEAELDSVLEKVSRFGKSSLTEREQQILLRKRNLSQQAKVKSCRSTNTNAGLAIMPLRNSFRATRRWNAPAVTARNWRDSSACRPNPLPTSPVRRACVAKGLPAAARCAAGWPAARAGHEACRQLGGAGRPISRRPILGGETRHWRRPVERG